MVEAQSVVRAGGATTVATQGAPADDLHYYSSAESSALRVSSGIDLRAAHRSPEAAGTPVYHAAGHWRIELRKAPANLPNAHCGDRRQGTSSRLATSPDPKATITYGRFTEANWD